MASTSPLRENLFNSLPQYGFETDIDFESLVKTNRFLFRVYTPKERSPFFDDTDPFFLAPKFNEQYTHASEPLSEWRSHVGTYDDVVRHMDWTTRPTSAYISTSFSFIWSIWEALRRYHIGIKKDVQIAIIDAMAVSESSYTAVQLLRKNTAKERRREHWKWYRFAQESQSVLVHGCIPGTAVLASVPLLSILQKLPSYFLRGDPLGLKGNPLSRIAWDYTERKPSFRQFCQDMSDRFLRLPQEARLRDTTTGSVGLAISFLRPWFHEKVVDDYQAATATLCVLAFVIAQWPGQWWVRDHSEMWDLIRAMVNSLAEEIREKQQEKTTAEVMRLQGVVDNLEDLVKNYEGQISSHDDAMVRNQRSPLVLLSPPAPLDTSFLYPPPLPPHIIDLMPSPLAPVPGAFLDSPTIVRGSQSATQNKPLVEQLPTAPSSPILSPLPEAPISTDFTPQYIPSLPELTPLPPSSPPSPKLSPVSHIGLRLAPTSEDIEPLSLPILPSVDETPSPTFESPETEHEDGPVERPYSTIETASCLVTGFLVGAFITLCLLSPQRRTLLTHLT